MNKTQKIFVDTDVFVALAKKNDTNHKKAIKLLQKFIQKPVTFLTSSYVFSECVTVISMRIGHKEAILFIDTIRSRESKFIIEKIDPIIEESAIEIFKKQSSKNTSFVDCTNIALVKKLGVDMVFSFDEVYRKNGLTMVA